MQHQQMWQLYYQQQQRYSHQYQQWMAMYQQMCSQAASTVGTQSGHTPRPTLQQQAAQALQGYPYGAWTPRPSAPVQPRETLQLPTQRLARAHSAPTQVQAQPAALPVVAPQQPAVDPAPVEVPAEPQPAAEPAVPAAEPMRFAALLQPAVMFRLFMFYYLFSSPTLPEWQRTAFLGALVIFYLYSVDLIGYLFPGRRQGNAAPDLDLDIIPQGPNDADENNNNAHPQRIYSHRELIERFVVGLFASLLPSWNPATMN